jgi:hypothetical protein
MKEIGFIAHMGYFEPLAHASASQKLEEKLEAARKSAPALPQIQRKTVPSNKVQ